jgi:hypothetical protein
MNETTRAIKPADIAKGAQPEFFDHPAMEGMYGMLIVLMEDICVLRDRLDTYERLGAQGKAVTPEAVEAYELDEAAEQAREERRRRAIDRAMRPIRQLQHAAVVKAQQNYEKAARQISEQDI